MQISTKTGDILGQLARACEEMAAAFRQMESSEPSEQENPDTWGQAVNALSETLAVARVQWAELTAQRAAASGGGEYSIHLLDGNGMPSAGASFPAASDLAAEDEARALALMHEWARRATLLRKCDGHKWTIQIRVG